LAPPFPVWWEDAKRGRRGGTSATPPHETVRSPYLWVARTTGQAAWESTGPVGRTDRPCPRPRALRMTKFWGKPLMINFAMGVVSGDL